MLEFLKAPFFAVKFSYYSFMTFLMILSVILLSMLMILLYTLSIIRYLNEWKVITSRKSSQEYPVNAGVPQGSLLGHKVFLLYFNDLPGDIVCNISIDADDTTLCSKYDQASDLWQQLELASELESDPQGIVDWGRQWLINFNAGKTQLVSLTGLITLVLLIWKWISLFLWKYHLLKCGGWLSLLNWMGLLQYFYC